MHNSIFFGRSGIVSGSATVNSEHCEMCESYMQHMSWHIRQKQIRKNQLNLNESANLQADDDLVEVQNSTELPDQEEPLLDLQPRNHSNSDRSDSGTEPPKLLSDPAVVAPAESVVSSDDVENSVEDKIAGSSHR
jgi:hypothetical protein